MAEMLSISPLTGMGIGMVAEKYAAQSRAPANRWRLGLVLLQRLDDLGAHPGQRLAVEARMGQRQLQQMHRLRRILLQGGDGDHQIIAFGAGAEGDGAVGQRLVEGLGIQAAGALIDHGAGKGGQPRLARPDHRPSRPASRC